MKENKTLRSVLASLNAALFSSQQEIIEKILMNNELSEILSQDAISIARAEGKPHLVQFLCTLAVHNDIEKERAQHWLDVYQSLINHELSTSLNQLSRNNVLRLTIEALKTDKSLTAAELKKVKGNSLMWIDAIDLSLDNNDWNTVNVLVENLGKRQNETKTWIHISQHLNNRQAIYINQTGLQKVDVDYRCLANLYSLCSKAINNAGLVDAANSLKILQAKALETAGDHELSIKIIKSLHEKVTGLNTELARLYCKKNDLKTCITFMDKALLGLKGPSEESLKVAESFFESEKKQIINEESKKFNISAASMALSDLVRIADNKNIDVFLVSGTLLGCIREGGFLSHDKDIDVGIIGWEQQYILCTALFESGLFHFNAQFLKGQTTYYLPIQHKVTGMWIDVFIYQPMGNKLVTGVDFFFGYRQTFSFTPFELEKREFIGIDVLIPKDYDLNLKENFGYWKVPDPNYISHLESPSTDNKGDLPFMLTARLAAYASITKKNPKKIFKVLAIMEENGNKMLSMPEAVANHLKKIANSFSNLYRTEDQLVANDE
jgi:hypothetical protein